jgi:putative ABC transport system substrate-binding protein
LPAARDCSDDPRSLAGDVVRIRGHAAELVGLSPDVLLAYASAQLPVLAREMRAIPIVFIGASDPVGVGFVASFARPGGNITGFTTYEPSLGGKWLATLKEIAPGKPLRARARVMGHYSEPESLALRDRQTPSLASAIRARPAFVFGCAIRARPAFVPRGSRPSMAAFTSSGARNASSSY